MMGKHVRNCPYDWDRNRVVSLKICYCSHTNTYLVLLLQVRPPTSFGPPSCLVPIAGNYIVGGGAGGCLIAYTFYTALKPVNWFRS
jgi:hypothetical protein